MSYLWSPSLVLEMLPNAFWWMSGGPSRQGNRDFDPEGGQSHCSKLVANNPLGSNAVHLLIFRLRWRGRYPSMLFGPGPISSVEIWVRELKRGVSNRDNCGIMKSSYIIHPELCKTSKPTLYCASDNGCFGDDAVFVTFCRRASLRESRVAISVRYECVRISH